MIATHSAAGSAHIVKSIGSMSFSGMPGGMPERVVYIVSVCSCRESSFDLDLIK